MICKRANDLVPRPHGCSSHDGITKTTCIRLVLKKALSYVTNLILTFTIRLRFSCHCSTYNGICLPFLSLPLPRMCDSTLTHTLHNGPTLFKGYYTVGWPPRRRACPEPRRRARRPISGFKIRQEAARRRITCGFRSYRDRFTG